MIWTLEIPNWHPTLVNKWDGRHWGVRSKAKNLDSAMLVVQRVNAGVPKANGKRWVRFTLFGWANGRLPDPDAILKSGLDGLKRAGLLVDDSQKWCEWDRPVIMRSTAEKTVIELSDSPWVSGAGHLEGTPEDN